jgi:hypothetical protein
MSEYTEQAETFLKRHHLTFSAAYVGFDEYFPDDKEPRSIYTLTLTSTTDRRRSYSTRFGASINMTNEGTEPEAYDLLTCITKSDPGTFGDFCDEYGYSNDSISASKTYRAVRRDWMKVRRFFTDQQITELHLIN